VLPKHFEAVGVQPDGPVGGVREREVADDAQQVTGLPLGEQGVRDLRLHGGAGDDGLFDQVVGPGGAGQPPGDGALTVAGFGFGGQVAVQRERDGVHQIASARPMVRWAAS
jgi:hypothetical protein